MFLYCLILRVLIMEFYYLLKAFLLVIWHSYIFLDYE